MARTLPTLQQGCRVMFGQDAELDVFRSQVSCAALLERSTPAWKLDKRGSTRRALKYRRNEGEILIVNHDERGWWDPLSQAKGDVFDLVRHLDPALTFSQIRMALRCFVGVAPTYPVALRERREHADWWGAEAIGIGCGLTGRGWGWWRSWCGG